MPVATELKPVIRGRGYTTSVQDASVVSHAVHRLSAKKIPGKPVAVFCASGPYTSGHHRKTIGKHGL